MVSGVAYGGGVAIIFGKKVIGSGQVWCAGGNGPTQRTAEYTWGNGGAGGGLTCVVSESSEKCDLIINCVGGGVGWTNTGTPGRGGNGIGKIVSVVGGDFIEL